MELEKKLEKANCLICNSKESIPFKEVVNRFDFEEKYKLVSCGKCGFVYLNPRLISKFLDFYYEDDRYQPHQLDEKSTFDKLYDFIRTWNNRYKRFLIEKYFLQGNLLDFGCGSGEFLGSMKKTGWNVAGVERAQKPRDYAASLDLDIREEIDQFKDQFDVITLWHVLEHISDAHQLMEEIKKRLSNSGILIIALPNVKSYDAQMFDSNWIAFDAPRHLYHFNPNDILQLVRMHGLEVFNFKTLFIDTWYNSLLSWQLESQTIKKNFFCGISKFLTVAILSTIKETFNRFYSSSVIYFIKKSK